MPSIFKSIALLLLLVSSLATQAQREAIEKLLDAKKYKDAYQLVNKELEKKPNDAVLNYLKWDVSYRGGIEVKENFKFLNKAIDLDKNFSEAYVSRATFYMAILRFEDAKEDIDEAVKTANTDSLKISSLLILGSWYSATRQHQKAADVNEQILKMDSVNVPALNNVGMAYQDLGQLDKALGVLYKIEKLQPNTIYAVVNIGFILTKMKDYQKAVEYFNKAEKISKNEPLIFSNRAEAKFNLKDYGGAMADINKSIKLFPTNSYAYRVRALIYLDQKNTDKACEDLNTALAYKYTEQYDDDVKQMRDKYCIK